MEGGFGLKIVISCSNDQQEGRNSTPVKVITTARDDLTSLQSAGAQHERKNGGSVQDYVSHCQH